MSRRRDVAFYVELFGQKCRRMVRCRRYELAIHVYKLKLRWMKESNIPSQHEAFERHPEGS